MRLLPHLPWLGVRMIHKASSTRYYTVMASRTYNDAIDLLNTLQTSAAILKQRRDAGIKLDATGNKEMRKHLSRIGYSQSDLAKLNIVHVAGTKGKGSTCAYVDSILSQYHLSHGTPTKVGLFTSPHLIAVRERIRIDSAPISASLFAKYFFEVWDLLEASPVPVEKPVYFRYLNLMSYHAFIQEGVDVAIYEVGVGGEYDSTNIVDRPAVTGISTLGIDHVFTLGDTIDKIAWHKAGIMKKDVPAFSAPQLPAAMEVAKARAVEREVKSFEVVGTDPRLEGVKIRPDAPHQRGNASLAIALAETVLKKLDPSFQRNPDTLPKEFIDGLEQVVWRGRCEKKDGGEPGNITYYLDGAHTADSINVAVNWFAEESSIPPLVSRFSEFSTNPIYPPPITTMAGPKVLIFNQQGYREALELLEVLYREAEAKRLRFDYVIFCPTVPITKGRKDHISHATSKEDIASLALQKAFAAKWVQLDIPNPTTHDPSMEDLKAGRKSPADASSVSSRTVPESNSIIDLDPLRPVPEEMRDCRQYLHTEISVLPSFEDALVKVKMIAENILDHDPQLQCLDYSTPDVPGRCLEQRAHVFVTGSVHLVGRALGELEGKDAL